ncbi:DNA repair protein RadC [Xanthomonas arboricola pv. celebensis]|nr:DNA repair protein RadC [Xanthomonas arboricola pv. celebensis]
MPSFPGCSRLTPSARLLEPGLRAPLAHYRPATADEILAAARRAVDQRMPRGDQFTTPTAVKNYLRTKLDGLEHELFAVLFLDNQHRLIECVEMFRGTVDGATVHPREVVKEALRCNAVAVIFSHNHPGGNPKPSEDDRLVTRDLKDALALVDVRTLDHILVAGDAAVSFVERGLL